jgi:hypothetical protein
MLGKIKNFVVEKFLGWLEDVWNKIKQNPRKSIFLILISPIIIYLIGEFLLSFSIFATIGYFVACLYGFSRILEDPFRMLKWGAGFAIGAAVIPLIFSVAWPEIQKGTSVSIFTGLIIFYIVVMVWLKARKIKKK